MISDLLVHGSDILIHAEKMGRIKYPVGIKLGRILSKMGRISDNIILSPEVAFELEKTNPQKAGGTEERHLRSVSGNK